VDAVEKKIVKKICKNCKSYVRKNTKCGQCIVSVSTREAVKAKKTGNSDLPLSPAFKNRDNNWTCEKFVERV
jgi:hypothetical protein